MTKKCYAELDFSQGYFMTQRNKINPIVEIEEWIYNEVSNPGKNWVTTCEPIDSYVGFPIPDLNLCINILGQKDGITNFTWIRQLWIEYTNE